MGSESPNVILYDVNGQEMSVTNGAAIPAGTSALMTAGSDGTNSRFITLDTSGRTVTVGAGTAGTPVGGVVSIQGVAGGTTVPVSGAVTITAADVTASGALGAANATVSVTHPGLQSIGMQLAAGTLVGTIVPEISFDGGTTWNPTFFDNPSTGNIVSSIVFGSANTATAQTIVGAGGAGMTRVRVSAYTSGTANATVRASDVNDPSVLNGGAAGSALPPVVQQMGGSVTTGSPTYVTATVNALSLTTAGALRIDGTATTQPVSGTVTANAGTGNFSVVQATAANLNATVVASGNFNNASVSATAAAPPASATYIGGSVTTASPTYTTGQMDPLSLTTAGALRIDGSAVTQPVSGTVTANAGTGTFTVAGTVTANQGTANTLANAWSTKITDATNGPVAVKAASTAAVAADPALVVAVSPNNSVAVTQATAANLNATVVQATPANLRTQTASESTTATTTGTVAALMGGAVTTASPTYTTGQMDPLSLTTAGALRIDGSAVTQPVSGTVTANQGTANTLANAWSTKITDATNGPVAVKAASTAAVAADPSLVTAFSPNSPLPTGANTIGIVNQGTAASLANAWSMKITDATNGPAAVKAASTPAVAADPALVVTMSPNSVGVGDTTATGTLGALNAAVQVTLAGLFSAGFQLAAGTLVGTIVAEVSFDAGTTWNATYIDQLGGNKVSSIVFGSSNTATSGTIVGVGGSGLARIRVSAYTSGTANITLRASEINDPSTLHGGVPSATVQPPTASQIAGWDSAGALRVPSVKATSTAPVVADQALVVVISPNQQAIPISTSGATATPGSASGYVTVSSTANTAQQGTTYTEQSANFTGSVKSSSANDTSAGTGARTITIYYVDATGATAGTENATLNGTTAVNLVTTTKCFIEKIVVTTVGSTGSNAGIISLFTGAAGAGTTVATIAVGDNQTYLGHHYVVTGKTCNITGITGVNNSTSNNTLFTLQAITLPVGNNVSLQISDWVSGSQLQQIVRLYDQLIKVPGPARIQLFGANAGTPSIKSQGSFDFYDQ